MRILNVMFNKGVGGVEYVFLRTTKLFQSWGWDVRTCTHSRAQINGSLDGLVDIHHQLKLAPHRLNTLYARWKLRRFVKKNGIDLVLIHNGKHAQFIYNSLHPWRHTNKQHLKQHLEQHLSLVGYCHGTDPRNLSNTDHVITLTPKMHQQFQDAGVLPTHLSLIPHALDSSMRPLTTKRSYQPKGFLRVGYLGRVEPAKGIETLLQAMAGLSHEHAGVSLQIGGSGTDRYLKKCHTLAKEHGISEHVSWAGWIRDKASFFANLDVLVVPSFSESFGLIILEAFAHRVPVVATDTDGPRAIITSGNDGVIFPRGNSDALANQLRKFMEDPALCAKLADQAHKTLVTTYSARAYESALCHALERISTTCKT